MIKLFEEFRKPPELGSDASPRFYNSTGKHTIYENPFFETGDIVKYVGDIKKLYGKKGKIIGVTSRYLAVEMFEPTGYSALDAAEERWGAKKGYGVFQDMDNFEMVTPVSQIHKQDLDTSTFDSFNYKIK